MGDSGSREGLCRRRPDVGSLQPKAMAFDRCGGRFGCELSAVSLGYSMMTVPNMGFIVLSLNGTPSWFGWTRPSFGCCGVQTICRRIDGALEAAAAHFGGVECADGDCCRDARYHRGSPRNRATHHPSHTNGRKQSKRFTSRSLRGAW